jgi:D-sedoheptulose 7-phosphate isomerase
MLKERVKDILLENIRIKEDIAHEALDRIVQIAELIIQSLKKGGKILIFGNGGSAADSQHIAAEFVGRFKKDRRALKAIALTTDTSVITSLSNDYGYEMVFLKQIEALAEKNDVVIGISTSGRTKNIIAAIKQAKKMGIRTVVFTGAGGGELAKSADLSFVVPSLVTARIQEAHITVGHIICELAEEALC